ncbi:hypothetical protein DAI22_03g005400 [Oryza sativa Japonica Group]|nr:hypothetical protein DAI22_03g005400 [Oryza sativa Japonica Group]
MLGPELCFLLATMTEGIRSLSCTSLGREELVQHK